MSLQKSIKKQSQHKLVIRLLSNRMLKVKVYFQVKSKFNRSPFLKLNRLPSSVSL